MNGQQKDKFSYNPVTKMWENSGKAVAVCTLDDLRELKFKIGQLDKGHHKPAYHDWKSCPDCNLVAELRASVFSYQRNRTEWLERSRKQDKAEAERVERKIYNFKHKRKVRA